MKFFQQTKEKKFERGLSSTTFSFLKTKSSAGFTIIETFIAITILIISIVGPFTLVMTALSVSKATKGQITAMYLAQEAIEYVRNIRDENILTGNNWLTDLNGVKMIDTGGVITYIEDPTRNCIDNKCIVNTPVHRDVTICSGDCPSIKFNSDSKIYRHDVVGDPSLTKDSVFTRTVEIEEITDNIEVIITVIMEWQEGPREASFIISEHLLNWQ